MENKKGIVFLPILIIIGIAIGLFVLGSIIFSDTFRNWLLVGGIGVAGTLIALNTKDSRTKLIIFSVLFIGIFGFIIYSGTLQSITSERYVEIPAFGYIECRQLGTSAFPTFSIDREGEWITDELPKNTNEWSIQIQTPDAGSFSKSRRVEYYICNSRGFCSNRVVRDVNRRGDSINIGVVSSTRHVWVQFQEAGVFTFSKWSEDNEFLAKAEVTYKPFKLFRDDPIRGSGEISGTGCTLPFASNSWLNRITNYQGSDNIETYNGGRTLNVGQGFNYITTNLVSVQEGNTQSGGWCIYENGQANIYAIEKIETPSETYNRVNLDKKIGTDECCNGLSYRNAVCQNGNLIPTEEAECSSRADCGTLDRFELEGETKTGRWGCIEGECKIVDIQNVECTSDRDCRTNERCNFQTYECELSGEGGEGEDRQEDEPECEWYQEPYTKTEKDYGALYWRAYTPFVDPIETETSGCKTAGWVYITIFLIISGGLIFAITKTKKKKR